MEYSTEDIQKGGIILVNKPLTWTSFDVVKKIKFATRVKKIGHAGTLDPLATGLLIVCFGKHTKIIESIQEQKKTYTGTFKIGATTPSFDLESEEDAQFDVSQINSELIAAKASSFVGEIDQTPPHFSAVKVNGKRAYSLAREGEEFALKSKKITIESFTVDSQNFPFVDFEIVCSKGTYIRALARDLGEALGAGAYLTSLKRTQIGAYSVLHAQEPLYFDSIDTLMSCRQLHHTLT